MQRDRALAGQFLELLGRPGPSPTELPRSALALGTLSDATLDADRNPETARIRPCFGVNLQRCPAAPPRAFAHRLRYARLPALRQAPSGVKHPQDLNNVAPHSVRDDISGFGDDQFPCAVYAPRAAESWLLSQLPDRLEYPLDHETRGN